MVDFQTLSCNSSLIWWLVILSLPLHAYYSNLHMVMSQGIQLTPDNSNPRELEPRANSSIKSFLFRFRSFLCKFTLDNWNHVVIEPWQCFVFTFLSFQFKFRVHSCILGRLIASPPPPTPIHSLILLFQVICFKLPITRTLFDFPRRFELSGVHCTLIK